MNDKEKIIIEAAIKLFAQKGFSSTSIQEIASKSGISKGAFYLHFKSKEALLLAILQYYYEKLKEEVFSFRDDQLRPKEQFLFQLKVFIKTILEHHEFIIMISREQTIPINDSTKKLIFKMQLETHDFYHKSLRSIFGHDSEPYLWDLSIMMEGMLSGYVKVLLFNNEKDYLDHLEEFLFNRIEAIYYNLIQTKENPIFSKKIIKEILVKRKVLFEKESEDVIKVLEKMKNKLNTQEVHDNQGDLIISLEVIESELARQEPRVAVIQGMLSNFRNLPDFEDEIKMILAQYR